MFNSPVLDLVIVLSFTYFVLSLLVSTIHEFIYSVLSCKRGVYLQRAIVTLFFDAHWTNIAEQILNNPHITALRSDGNTQPSYIPAKNFALALLDLFRGTGTLSFLDMNRIRRVLEDESPTSQLPKDSEVRRVLLSLFERAQGDLAAFQKQIEAFYEDAMERAGGVYKRATRKAVLVISFVIACTINADTVHIARTLWENPAALQTTADNAQQAVEDIRRETSENLSSGTFSFEDNRVTYVQRDTTHEGDTNSAKDIVREVRTSVAYLKNAGIPIGWSMSNVPAGEDAPSLVWGWIFKLFGLTLTAAALMLGAPFWFDLLNKITNIRATGKKPQEGNNPATGPVNPNTFLSSNAVG